MSLEPMLQQGLALFGRRDYDAALACFDKMLATEPAHLHALNARGGALLQLGRGEEALECFERVLRIAPSHVLALNNQGSVLAQMGRHEEALACFRRAGALEPWRPETLSNQGLMLERLGRPEEALDSYDAALRINARHPATLRWKARALHKLGRHAQVLACCDLALSSAPGHLDTMLLRAAALGGLERHTEALACLDEALRLAPGHAETLVKRGGTLVQLHRGEEALASFERALEAAPDLAEALDGRGIALLKCHRDAEALAWYEKVLATQPRHPWMLNNCAAALLGLNRVEEALARYEEALTIDPQHADAQYGRSFALLTLGRLEEGFHGQERRWASSTGSRPLRLVDTTAPLWLGAAPVEGRSILLYHEQGLGDTLQFMRYAPLLAARGARVILAVPPELLRLARTLPGVAEVTDRTTPPPHDLQCPMMSLPLAFGTQLETIPAPTPYLRADEESTAAWRKRLEETTPPPRRPRVGLVWAGRQAPPLNLPRDMRLDALRPVLAAGAELGLDFVSLQKDIPAGDRALLDALPQVARHGESLTDFADTAALLMNLDLLITVDTSAVHLAGALGRPVWLMNRHATCWRWFRERTDSPWYPSLRIFRQPAHGDWDSVAAQVRAALMSRFGAEHTAPPPAARARSLA